MRRLLQAHRSSFWIIAIAGAALAALLFSISPSTRYRRYLSPPFPDGSRYTFLYPSHLKTVSEGWYQGAIQSVRIDSGAEQFTILDRIKAILGIPWLPKRGSITVVVGAAAETGAVDRQANVQAQRKDDLRVVGDDCQHNIYLVDGPSRMRLLLYHEERFHPDLFNETDAVVSRSFRVVPPVVRGQY